MMRRVWAVLLCIGLTAFAQAGLAEGAAEGVAEGVALATVEAGGLVLTVTEAAYDGQFLTAGVLLRTAAAMDADAAQAKLTEAVVESAAGNGAILSAMDFHFSQDGTLAMVLGGDVDMGGQAELVIGLRVQGANQQEAYGEARVPVTASPVLETRRLAQPLRLEGTPLTLVALTLTRTTDRLVYRMAYTIDMEDPDAASYLASAPYALSLLDENGEALSPNGALTMGWIERTPADEEAGLSGLYWQAGLLDLEANAAGVRMGDFGPPYETPLE